MIRRTAKSNRLGVTLQFPLQLDASGGFVLAVDAGAVESHMMSIIEATRGTHLMEAWFGVISLPFLSITQTAGLCELIKAAIRLAETRIYPDLLEVTASPNGLDAGVLPITISYVIRDQATPNLFTYGFRVMKPEVAAVR